MDPGRHPFGCKRRLYLYEPAPVLTAIIAAVFLKEELHSYHIIGGGVVLIGVIMAQRLRTPLTQIIRRKTKNTAATVWCGE